MIERLLGQKDQADPADPIVETKLNNIEDPENSLAVPYQAYILVHLGMYPIFKHCTFYSCDSFSTKHVIDAP